MYVQILSRGECEIRLVGVDPQNGSHSGESFYNDSGCWVLEVIPVDFARYDIKMADSCSYSWHKVQKFKVQSNKSDQDTEQILT